MKAKTTKNAKRPWRRKVRQLTLDGKPVAEFPSTVEAERQTGFSQTYICACCRGKHEQAYGWRWEYADEFLNK